MSLEGDLGTINCLNIHGQKYLLIDTPEIYTDFKIMVFLLFSIYTSVVLNIACCRHLDLVFLTFGSNQGLHFIRLRRGRYSSNSSYSPRSPNCCPSAIWAQALQ